MKKGIRLNRVFLVKCKLVSGTELAILSLESGDSEAQYFYCVIPSYQSCVHLEMVGYDSDYCRRQNYYMHLSTILE